jgi:cobalt-zinc-cadmium efflux system membrane fusion protein
MTVRTGLMATLLLLAACSGETQKTPAEIEAAQAAATAEAEVVRGPNGGRMLTDGDFAIEMAIFEGKEEPQFRAFATLAGEPIEPGTVELAVTVTRLGGKVETFQFAAGDGYLASKGALEEPHSFDVKVVAVHAGKRHSWAYENHEGRTRIAADAAREGGIAVERAGPVTLDDSRELLGTVELAPNARSQVRARFPGKVMAVNKQVGDRVRAGDVLARVESNESLQTYSVIAPVSGTIFERATNVGDVAGNDPIFVIADPAKTTVVFNIFPRDLEVIRGGQQVVITTLDGAPVGSGRLSAFLPDGNRAAGTALVRADLPNPTGQWRPGMALKGRVIIGGVQVPLAVRTDAIQPFRDFQVVFAKVGDEYEARMLELGRKAGDYTEVLGGLDPGTTYVTKGSFLVRADVEKSGASHDH